MSDASPAVAVVQRQLEAYNRRDFEVFVACYSNDIRVFRMPGAEPAMIGRTALRDFYAKERFNRPALHAEVRQRIAIGNKVIDHEHITGLGEGVFEVVAVYEVSDDAIAAVWFFYPG
jgi:hypothetical protein